MSYDYTGFSVQDIFSVKGKVALITGGSSGLGLNMAHALVRNGCKVYISSRKQKQCDEAVKELSAYGEAVAIACDASSVANIEKLVKTISEQEPNGVHICIANAGATWGEEFDKMPEQAFDKVMNLNVRSVFYTIQKMLPLLEKAGTPEDPARVIATGSVAGVRVSGPTVTPYSTSKAAVHHMMRNLALSLGPRNITCNSIAPGYFPSKMTAGTIGGHEKELSAGNPRRRLGLPLDIAATALFLCGRGGQYVNGVTIPLDGGESLGAASKI